MTVERSLDVVTIRFEEILNQFQDTILKRRALVKHVSLMLW